MLNDTRYSLLQRAMLDRNSEAWFQLNRIYEPLIAGWVVRAGIEEAEVGDITQEVMQTLAKDLERFEHNGRVGAFRRWLNLIAINRCRRYWHLKKREVFTTQPVDNESASKLLDNLEDPGSDISRLWDEEHDNYILQKMIQLVRKEFDKLDGDVFVRNAIDGAVAKEVSDEFGISISQVYKIKFRILNRLKEAAAGLLDGPLLDNPDTEM